ncbi:ras guanine nucleotide exchange factor E [Episyrphus balteatus]|uniref:ras guanine nucleotide exchange factor E n=1 Tax=Episyrphus balteatus TaxID=286459 RepID=UPI0024862156|nr:ras guanine nucleotide exchange factor E [Episyrphus balteatus]
MIDFCTSSSTNKRTISSKPTTINNGSVTNVMIAINNTKHSQPQLSAFTIAQDNNNNNNKPNQISQPAPIGGHQQGKAPATAPDLSPPDFDFNLPCRYFKSSFARSLSLNSGASVTAANQSKSMDYIGTTSIKNGGFHQSTVMATSSPLPPPPPVVNRKCSTDIRISNNANEGSRRNSEMLSEIAVPPIPARRQNIETSAIIPTASVVNGSTHLLRNVSGSTNRVTNTGNGNGNINNSGRLPHVANNGGNGNSSHFVRRNVCWPPSASSTTVSSSSPSSGLLSSGEQESQLLDETEHELIKTNGEYIENRFEIVDPSTNVEAVILQNQVDTLQWQLKQAETSCGMYRAVMEEVARFLERFQKNSACSRSEQISRSKSMYHVYSDHDKGSDSGNSSVYPRARSSTNLIDLKRMSPSSCGGDSTKSGEEDHDHYDLASPINSYSTFKDFTWRRSPKKRAELKFNDDAEEKLNKEAFRLSRTIHNLLHTQQPDLTQHRQSLTSRVKPIPNENIPPEPAAAHQKANNLTAEMLFLRTMNMRDSRLSLRSSTDSSVHSTSSSSKVEETDEENNYSPPLLAKQCANLCSTTEDESGFSSISSFQEIGVPLSSTMISSSSASSSHLDDSIDQSDINNLDSRNSTLKAGVHAASMLANNVGLPLSHDVNNRWDSKTYRKNKFQRFSTLSNEDSSTVLWV